MTEITIIPIGGLANRMLSVSSFVSFCRQTNSQLKVIWFKDKGLNCSFHKLFRPLTSDFITIREAGIADHLFRNRRLKRNFGLPELFYPLQYDRVINEKEYFERKFYSGLVENLPAYKKILIVACCQLEVGDRMSDLLTPTDRNLDLITQRTEKFTPDTIGIHIRRTDHQAAIQNSPVELFIEKMQEEIDKNANVSFYLASDALPVKQKLLHLFGHRIITSSEEAKRDSEQGVIDALVDMYALSKTRKIYGSFESTFSMVAGQLSGISYELLTINNKA